MTDDLDLSVLLEERINVPAPVPCELPVLPLINTVVFPQVVAPIFVSRQQAQHALDVALAGDRMVLTIVQRDDEVLVRVKLSDEVSAPADSGAVIVISVPFRGTLAL